MSDAGTSTPDFYQLLEIPRNATPEQITKAIDAKIRFYSKRTNAPNVADRTQAEAALETLGQMKKTLLDPAQRREYDVTLNGSYPEVINAPIAIAPEVRTTPSKGSEQLPPTQPSPPPPPTAPASNLASLKSRSRAAAIDLVFLIGVSAALEQAVGRAAFWLVVWPLYALPVGITGQSLGLRICHLRVVAISTGRPIGVWRSTLRLLGIFVTFLWGFVWVFWDRKKQALHDKVGRDIVIYDR
ncbi:MAG TPA: RDD family protein [Solirubrobacteraceae bacterium]|jgi:uncharacterized RDD family membrane protein YckC|nr:RDD family protein [Solirubrobacteraceae bacterium]